MSFLGGGQDISSSPNDLIKPYVENLYGSAYNLYNNQRPEYYQPTMATVTTDPTQQGAYDAAKKSVSSAQAQVDMLTRQLASVSKFAPSAVPAFTKALAAAKAKLAQSNQTLSGIQTTTQRQYNDALVAGPNALQQEASSALINRAREGSDLYRSASDQMQKTVNGDYLNPDSNPYLSAIYNKGANDITNRVGQQMMMAGRGGSGANQTMLTNQLGDFANQLYGGNYQTERDRQFNATGAAPSFAQNDYNDINQLSQAGKSQQDYQQKQIDADRAAWDYSQNQPFNQLSNYASLLYGIPGSQATNQSTNNKAGALDVVNALF